MPPGLVLMTIESQLNGALVMKKCICKVIKVSEALESRVEGSS